MPQNEFLSMKNTIHKTLFGPTRKTQIVSGVALFFALCAFGVAGVAPLPPDPAEIPTRALTQVLAQPALLEQIPPQQSAYFTREELIRPGDTLATLLHRLDIRDEEALRFIKTDKLARQIIKLNSKTRVQTQSTADGKLQWLSAMVDDANKNILITKENGQFKAAMQNSVLEKRIEMRTAVIHSSLFAATDEAQVPESIAKQMVDVLSSSVDFASDLKQGDSFSVIYETFWHNGTLVKNGRLLASEFKNNNEIHQAVWFSTNNNSQGEYFNGQGKSLKKAFLRSPIQFSRISSGFSMRTHPISGQWKQHQGVDFAAPTGTPIHATSDGVLDFIGRQNGYGNTIILQHANNNSTLYAHMSRFAPGIRKGSKVQQGDVIGYVGSTGWSTGPHLHYEFRHNNIALNPLTINIANNKTLNSNELNKFKTSTSDITHRLNLLRPPAYDQVALLNN
jgi:murein DD-endopeptidase MepM/ murein hydrolase activator NlpD